MISAKISYLCSKTQDMAPTSVVRVAHGPVQMESCLTNDLHKMKKISLDLTSKKVDLVASNIFFHPSCHR